MWHKCNLTKDHLTGSHKLYYKEVLSNVGHVTGIMFANHSLFIVTAAKSERLIQLKINNDW